MHEQGLAGLEVGGEEHVGPHGARDLGKRRRLDERDPGRHRQQLTSGHAHQLGVPPAREQRADLVADRPALDPVAQGLDRAADLEPGHVGFAGRRGVVALPLQHVGTVDPGGGDPHQDLAGGGLGVGHLAEHQGLGAAELGDRDRLHAFNLCRGAPDAGSAGEGDGSIRPLPPTRRPRTMGAPSMTWEV